MERLLTVCGLLLAGCSAESEADVGTPALVSRPLASPAGGDGPRFARLDPAISGLRFAHELRPENNIAYVYAGAGVAVGDYDADGLPDVYLVSQDGPNRLFRQVAPLRFQDVTESAGGLSGGDAWGSAASFADIDGDGDLDLYVCNLEAPNLLYRNDGDGTFTECARQWGLAVVAASMGVAFADYDNDGDLDLYLVTNRVFGARTPVELIREVTLPKDTAKSLAQLFPPYPQFEERDGQAIVPAGYEDFYFTIGNRVFLAGQRDRLFRNDGFARWRDVTDRAGIDDRANGLSATWWDMDGDGWLDLYVANDLESPDCLYRNRGDGTFENVTRTALPYTAFFGMGSDFGDVDNDGRLDLCVGDMSSTSHYMGKLLMGNMGDNRWFLMNADPQQYMRNMLYVNTGTPRFVEAGHLAGVASSDWTWTVRLADLDDDGRLDFFATNGIPRFEDDPDAAREFTRLWRDGRRAAALELARNLRTVPEPNVARRNVGDLEFADVGPEWGLDEAGVSYGAAIADLDRDGDLDIVVNNMNAPASLLENRGSGAHRVLVELRGTASNRFGVGATIVVEAGGVAQTRLVSPTRGYMSAGEPVEHFGLGAATRVDRLTVRWPSGAVQEFRDLAVDHLHTVREVAGEAVAPAPAAAAPRWFEAVAAPPVRHGERDFDDYALQPLLPHRLSRLGPGLACGDVDGDGRDDLWVGGAAGQAGSLCVARGDGRFAVVDGPWRGHTEREDLGAVFVDHDADGDLDLYVASGSIEAGDDETLLHDRLYVNDGDLRFSIAPAGTIPERAVSGSCVCAADFDRDGDVDLFVGGRTIAGRYPHAPPSALLRNDGGRFVDVTATAAPALAEAGMVTGAVWTDLDGDGFLDLAIAAHGQPLRILHNDGGARLSDATAATGLGDLHGQWNGIAAADLDGDGDVDLVATNLGLNTKYRADAAHPLRIYAADYDSDGELDVVEAKTAKDVAAGELPVRGLSCSSAAMPFLADRFPSFDAFARASLADIYGAVALRQSFELRFEELRSVVLENRDGGFALHPLPRRAQIAPGFGVGVADFDGDGRVDLAIAQNFYGPEPETGRFSGGVGAVLAGRGGLRFDVLSPDRAGVVMPEDATGLAVLDVDDDGAPDFACATNDGPLRLFRAQAGAPMLAVRLAGPPGNPTALGARLTITGPDGRRVVRELSGGSGYLAQSAPLAFFGPVARGSRLRVRWPDGAVTECELETAHGIVEVAR
ncbi:MAG: VCBS repeat-containing protein [Planctomycetes bacterium]|nr:VCBS repeat-containing protein [Planctomycetota bacterium]